MLLAVRDFSFHDAKQRFLLRQATRGRADEDDRQSEALVRITSNTRSHKGKEDFTESALNTEAIRKQRFTFAERKEYVFRQQRRKDTINKRYGFHRGNPHNILGNPSLLNRIILFQTSPNHPIFAP